MGEYVIHTPSSKHQGLNTDPSASGALAALLIISLKIKNIDGEFIKMSILNAK